MCMVQTAHGVTQSLNHLATEYLICVTIPDPLHQVSYSCHDSRHCLPYRTYHPHTTRQANVILQTNRDKGKITKMSWIQIQTSASQ
jgi:hypothetical protein